MSESADKLDWLAFRYVANELDATETSDFESLLMMDQGAREAVARAVEEATRIRQALAGAAVVTAATRPAGWGRKPMRVVLVAAGSCLTLLLALCLVRLSPPMAGGVARHVAGVESWDSPAELAYAWADARNGSVELLPATDLAPVDALDPLPNASLDAEADESLGAPSWMLAALAKMERGTNSELESPE